MPKFTDRVASLEVEVEKPSRMIVLGFDRQPLRGDDGSTNYIDLFSADSQVARKHQRLVTNRRLAMRGRGKLTAAELESEAVELLVALTAGWGTISKDGAVTADEFSPSDARDLYSNPKNSELRAQVDEFTAERGNFLTALSTNSSSSLPTSSAKAGS